jgi:putative endonuclease
MRTKDAVGRYGEDLAARHLRESGLAILERNWRCRDGEIDIVARDGDALVMCEVKTRSGTGFGTALEAVTPAKAARLRRLATQWLAARRLSVPEVRFDVIGVSRRPDGVAVEHLRGVV